MEKSLHCIYHCFNKIILFSIIWDYSSSLFSHYLRLHQNLSGLHSDPCNKHSSNFPDLISNRVWNYLLWSISNREACHKNGLLGLIPPEENHVDTCIKVPTPNNFKVTPLIYVGIKAITNHKLIYEVILIPLRFADNI